MSCARHSRCLVKAPGWEGRVQARPCRGCRQACSRALGGRNGVLPMGPGSEPQFCDNSHVFSPWLLLIRSLAMLTKLHVTEYGYFPKGLLLRTVFSLPRGENIFLGSTVSFLEPKGGSKGGLLRPGERKVWVGRLRVHARMAPFLPCLFLSFLLAEQSVLLVLGGLRSVLVNAGWRDLGRLLTAGLL